MLQVLPHNFQMLKILQTGIYLIMLVVVLETLMANGHVLSVLLIMKQMLLLVKCVVYQKEPIDETFH